MVIVKVLGTKIYSNLYNSYTNFMYMILKILSDINYGSVYYHGFAA